MLKIKDPPNALDNKKIKLYLSFIIYPNFNITPPPNVKLDKYCKFPFIKKKAKMKISEKKIKKCFLKKNLKP